MPKPSFVRVLAPWSPVLMLALVFSGCSIKKMAMNSLANSLSEGSSVFASDEDPELVREALPFALKTLESLLVQLPEHRNLLLAACSGFTQYAFAFVQTDADLIEEEDYSEAERLRERALRLYLRAKGYGLQALELKHPGLSEIVLTDPEGAVADAREEEVPFLYWTAAAWGAAIAVAKDRPELVADLPVVSAMIGRALELDEDYESGAIHEFLITLESLPANMGGSLDRARDHFKRAVELSGGGRASTYVSLAENVSIQTQNRDEFEDLVAKALAVDPDADPAVRLQTRIVQKRARNLLERIDDLFLDLDVFDDEEDERGSP